MPLDASLFAPNLFYRCSASTSSSNRFSSVISSSSSRLNLKAVVKGSFAFGECSPFFVNAMSRISFEAVRTPAQSNPSPS